MQFAENEFPNLAISRAGQVVTIRLKSFEDLPKSGPRGDIHVELGEVFSRLRGDTSSRVIVLTGYTKSAFFLPSPTANYTTPGGDKNNPAKVFATFTGVARTLETIVAIEKPVVAKVNGDVMGFGQSLVFACDFITADENATIVDHHMGNGEHGRGSPMGVVPGDGGAAFVPMHLPPCMAKEYLMLGNPIKAGELGRMGVINRAVPADQLDGVTDALVASLLERSAYALAWTKRVCNRSVVAELNERLDAGMGYEMVNFYQAERSNWQSVHKLD